MRGKHFLSFDPRGQGEAIEVVGDLATATRVAILVPGSDTSLTTFFSRGTASPGGGAPPWRRRPAGWTPAPTWRSSPGSATPPRTPSARPS